MSLRKIIMQMRCYCIKSPRRSAISITVQNAFGKHLLFTNIWTSGVLMVAGDVIQQEIEYQRDLQSKRYDWFRIGRMFITGLAFGPIHHYFYAWMDRILPGKSMNAISKKILLDQCVMSPVCIATLFYTMGVLEGKHIQSSTDELKSKFVEIYMLDWCLWPPTQFINFYYFPPKYQVLYINAVTMFYNVFLSYIKHRDTLEECKTETKVFAQ